MVKTSQETAKRAIEDTLTNTQTRAVKAAIDSSREKMDVDHNERERRKCNVVVRNVKESTSDNPADRKHHDLRLAQSILGIEKDEILKAFRAGPPTGPPGTESRPLIINVITPELASYIHNYGRGRRVVNRDQQDQIFWLNPDLIQADRLANYKARLAKRRPRNNAHVTLDDISEGSGGSPHSSQQQPNRPEQHSRGRNQRHSTTPDLRSPTHNRASSSPVRMGSFLRSGL